MTRKIRSDEVTYRPNFHIERIVVVGCGGIGSHLLPILAREMYFRSHMRMTGQSRQWTCHRIKLIDADIVEKKNLFRQDFGIQHLNMPKAEALANRFNKILSDVNITMEFERAWVDKGENPFNMYDAIMLCVDNNASRLIVNNMLEADNPCMAHIISGGNRDTLATVHVASREDGKFMTAPLTYRQPDIANPDDKHPKDVSCQDEQAMVDDPQVFRANHQAATMMNNVLWSLMDRETINYCQLWSDVKDMSFRKEPIPERESEDPF